MAYFFCLPSLAGLAQQPNEGHVTVTTDPRVDILIRRQIDDNLQALSHQPGFRVEVLLTSSRSKAQDVKAQMLRQFPQYRTYLIYQTPYFKVRVGDFKSRDDAAPLQDAISKLYPEGVFTVPDLINASDIQNDSNPTN